MNDNITKCINGSLEPGDLVLSLPGEDYACLVGTVLSIEKLGTPEHDTDNPSDDIHVNFMSEDYSEKRIQEIDSMISALYGESKSLLMEPLDDAIMAPEMLIRITGIGREELTEILDSESNAAAYCERAMTIADMNNENVKEVEPAVLDESQPSTPISPARAALYEPDASDDSNVAALREKLFDRLDKNLTDYFDTIRHTNGTEILDMATEIAGVNGAYNYLTEMHNFHTSEIEYLLMFQNPLEVVADQFQLELEIEEHSAVMWDIFDRQDALQGGYELESVPVSISDVNEEKSSYGHSVLDTGTSVQAVKDGTKANPDAGKPEKQKSVMEQIRQAQREKRERPPEQKDKSIRRSHSEEI